MKKHLSLVVLLSLLGLLSIVALLTSVDLLEASEVCCGDTARLGPPGPHSCDAGAYCVITGKVNVECTSGSYCAGFQGANLTCNSGAVCHVDKESKATCDVSAQECKTVAMDLSKISTEALLAAMGPWPPRQDP